MGAFYKTAGWMADLALLFNVFLLMGVLVSFGAVLTLPVSRVSSSRWVWPSTPT